MPQKNLFASYPDAGVLVAELISTFSTAEYALSMALSKFLGTDGLTITSCMFHQIRNISDRLEAFEHLVAGMAVLTPQCRLMECIADLQKANAFRNKIAHGVWGTEGDPPQLVLHTWLTSKHRKPERIPITIEKLQAELKRLQDTTGWLMGMGVGIEPLPEKLPQGPTLEDHIREVPIDPESAKPPTPPEA